MSGLFDPFTVNQSADTTISGNFVNFNSSRTLTKGAGIFTDIFCDPKCHVNVTTSPGSRITYSNFLADFSNISSIDVTFTTEFNLGLVMTMEFEDTNNIIAFLDIPLITIPFSVTTAVFETFFFIRLNPDFNIKEIRTVRINFGTASAFRIIVENINSRFNGGSGGFIESNKCGY